MKYAIKRAVPALVLATSALIISPAALAEDKPFNNEALELQMSSEFAADDLRRAREELEKPVAEPSSTDDRKQK